MDGKSNSKMQRMKKNLNATQKKMLFRISTIFTRPLYKAVCSRRVKRGERINSGMVRCLVAGHQLLFSNTSFFFSFCFDTLISLCVFVLLLSEFFYIRFDHAIAHGWQITHNTFVWKSGLNILYTEREGKRNRTTWCIWAAKSKTETKLHDRIYQLQSQHALRFTYTHIYMHIHTSQRNGICSRYMVHSTSHLSCALCIWCFCCCCCCYVWLCTVLIAVAANLKYSGECVSSSWKTFSMEFSLFNMRASLSFHSHLSLCFA